MWSAFTVQFPGQCILKARNTSPRDSGLNSTPNVLISSMKITARWLCDEAVGCYRRPERAHTEAK